MSFTGIQSQWCLRGETHTGTQPGTPGRPDASSIVVGDHELLWDGLQCEDAGVLMQASLIFAQQLPLLLPGTHYDEGQVRGVVYASVCLMPLCKACLPS